MIFAKLKAWVLRTLEEWDDAQMEASDLCTQGYHWVESGRCTDCGRLSREEIQ